MSLINWTPSLEHPHAHVYTRTLAQIHYTHAPHCPSSTHSRLPGPSTRVALPAHASVLPPGARRKWAARAGIPSPWRAVRYAPPPAARCAALGPRPSPASYTSPSTCDRRKNAGQRWIKDFPSYICFFFLFEYNVQCKCLCKVLFTLNVCVCVFLWS